MSYPQPGTPYAFIYFGGNLVTGVDKPNLLSFEYERGTTKGTNIASFTIVDEEWVALEKELANGKGKFSFSYGWADGSSGTNEGETWSPRYELALTKYKIKICNEHVQLSAQGKSPGHNLPIGPPTVQPNTNKTGAPNYHTALKKNLNDLGIPTKIWDPTDDNAAVQCKHNSTLPKPPPTNLCSVSPNQDVWNNGDHSATFNSGKSGGFYRWYVDNMGQVEACAKNRENPVVRSTVRRYSVPDLTGKNNEVVSFDPDFDLPAMLAGDNLGSRSNFTVNKSTGVNETTQVAQDEGEKENPYDPVKGLTSKQFSDKDGVNTTGHSYNEYGGSSEQLRRANVSFYNQRATFVNRATLVLIGDPTFRICDSVFITVNQTGKAKGTHYTTGEWLVVGIKDSIQPGNYQTTLTLKKLRTPTKSNVETVNELTELPNTTENYGLA